MSRAKSISNRLISAIRKSRIKALSASNRVVASVEAGFFLIIQMLRLALTDQAAFVDLAAKLFGKRVEDYPFAEDSHFLQAFKQQFDAADLFDDAFFDLLAQKSDTVSFAESVVVSATYQRVFADDSYFSDLAEMGIFKLVGDQLSVTDSQSLDVQKAKVDQASVSDHQSVDVSKGKLEQAFASDSILVAAQYLRDFYDQGGLADTHLIASSKALSDGVSFFEVVYVELVAAIIESDSASAQDIIELALALYKSDELAASDSVARQWNAVRAFDESPAASDVAGKASTKAQSDSGEVADSATMLASIAKNDNIATGDSGSLISQSYVDNPYYFAEDYVGTTRTF